METPSNGAGLAFPRGPWWPAQIIRSLAITKVNKFTLNIPLIWKKYEKENRMFFFFSRAPISWLYDIVWIHTLRSACSQWKWLFWSLRPQEQIIWKWVVHGFATPREGIQLVLYFSTPPWLKKNTKLQKRNCPKNMSFRDAHQIFWGLLFHVK